MPRARDALGRPADWFDTFPDGSVDMAAPAGAAELAAVASELRALFDAGEISVSGLARESGVHRTSIHQLLAGQIWIDTPTLARLEVAVGRRLWPSDVGLSS